MNKKSPFGDERWIDLSGLAASLDRDALALAAENPLHVFSCSYWENHAPWFVTRRRVMDNFCLFVLEGSMKLCLDHAEYLLKPGDCFLLGTEVYHAFGLPEGEKLVKHFIFHCLPGKFSFGNPVNRLKTPCHSFPLDEKETGNLKMMIGETQRGGSAGHRYCDMILNRLLFDLALRNEFDVPDCAVQNPRISASLHFLEANFRNGVSVADIAGAAGIGEVQCRKLFRKYTGLSPAGYLGRLRLSRAARMLLETSLSVKEIAELCGFSSECYFCYAFRKHLNCSPEKYRAMRK